MKMRFERMGFLAILPALAACRAPETPVSVRPTNPPSLRVEVSAGVLAGHGGRVDTKGATLSFDPPEVAAASWTDGIPRGVGSPDKIPADLWKGWNAFCPLPPENPKILGMFYRGIQPGSVVLKNHDGSATYREGQDYVLNAELGMILGIAERLGKRPADPKNPRPAETLQAEFRYYRQRLDLVQADAKGNLSVKKGPSAIICPVLPEPSPGCSGVAGVWVYGANSTGPVPARPEEVRIEAGDIALIQPPPPVAPVNAAALRPAMEKLEAGKPIGVGFFGDSIAVGCETPDWYFHSYSIRNTGFVGMVLRDLRARYPRADVQPAWGIVGAQSIFNEKLWTGILERCPERRGRCDWREGEAPSRRAEPAPPVDDLALRDGEMHRVLAGGEWLELSGGSPASPAFAEYDFDLDGATAPTLFLRSVRQRGTLRWRWDDGPWSEIKPDAATRDAEDVRQFVALCWYDLGKARLPKGRHTLRVELVPGEKLAGFCAIDCLMLAPDGIEPWRKYKPDEIKVDVIVYAMGMNGAHNERTPRAMHKETITRHIREARDRGAEVLLVSTMENHAHLPGNTCPSKKENRDLMAEIAAETGAPFADVYTEWMNQRHHGVPPETRLHNFLNHPDAIGHRLWADVILRAFDPAASAPAAPPR